MANLLQSNQQVQTTAPDYYTNYLSGIANQGQAAVNNAQYVGAQPLQTQAFGDIASSAGSTQPTFQQGQNLLNQAGQQNITGAGAGYLQAGTSNSPLNALSPYAQNAMAYTGTQAGSQGINAGMGISGLSSASPYLNNASNANAAGVSGQYVNQATNLNTLGSANPYLSQAAQSGGINLANPYLQAAATNNPGQMAQNYMSPYLQNQVQSTYDLGQRNIQQNLDPQATAAAVGSGQFGSQRGAQVLGQVNEQAQQDLNNTIANMEGAGYGQALNAAGQQQSLLGQLGNTAGTLGQQQANLLGTLGQTAGSLTAQQQQNLINAGNTQGTLTQNQANLMGQLGQTAGNLANTQASNLITGGTNLGNLQQGANTIASNLGSTAANAQAQQNQANLTAGQTAGNLAAQQASALNQAGLGLGTLGTQAGTQNLADINALATLGGQQQTIGQNQQLFPLNNLSTLSGMLRGYTVPTTTTTTANGSPLSALASIGSGVTGLFSGTGTGGTGPSLYNQLFGGNGITQGALSQMFSSNPSNITSQDLTNASNGSNLQGSNDYST